MASLHSRVIGVNRPIDAESRRRDAQAILGSHRRPSFDEAAKVPLRHQENLRLVEVKAVPQKWILKKPLRRNPPEDNDSRLFKKIRSQKWYPARPHTRRNPRAVFRVEGLQARQVERHRSTRQRTNGRRRRGQMSRV